MQHFHASEQEFVQRIVSVRESVLERNRPQLLSFMSVRELEIIEILCSKEVYVYADGAFTDSERKRVLITPFEQIDPQFNIVVGEIVFQEKYYDIDHRDVLGAILATGIERRNIGDIRIRGNKIQIAMEQSFFPYLEQELTQIGRAHIVFERIVPADNYIVLSNTFNEYEIIVSSLRLDTLVAKLCNVNRTKAKLMIERGFVQVNWQVVEQSHAVINDTDILSIRRFGRFYLEQVKGRTKKDNYVLNVKAHA